MPPGEGIAVGQPTILAGTASGHTGLTGLTRTRGTLTRDHGMAVGESAAPVAALG